MLVCKLHKLIDVETNTVDFKTHWIRSQHLLILYVLIIIVIRIHNIFYYKYHAHALFVVLYFEFDDFYFKLTLM